MALPAAAAVLLDENMQIHKGEIVFPGNCFVTRKFMKHITNLFEPHVQKTGLMHQGPNHSNHQQNLRGRLFRMCLTFLKALL